jgi:hypothetical protein
MMRFASGFGSHSVRTATAIPSSLPPIVAITLVVAVTAGMSSPAAGQPLEDAAAGSVDVPARVAARSTAEAEVRVQVPAVMRVRPESPVEMELTPAGNGVDTARLVVKCAGNVPHTVEIRGLAGHEGVTWTTPGSSWKPLGSGARPVAEALPPGRHSRCGVIRFRRPTGEGSPSGTETRETAPVVVALEVHRAR